MGRGNVLPHDRHLKDWETFYIEYGEANMSDEDAVEQMEQWWDDLMNDLYEALPPSFYKVDEYEYNDEHIIAKNELLDIRLVDNEWSLAVIIATIADDWTIPLQGLGARHIPFVYKRLTEYLGRLPYELSVRTGPWTSARLAVQ